jgi:hypothetical protein
MAEQSIPTVVVAATPRPIWIAAGAVLIGLTIGIAFATLAEIIIPNWKEFSVKLGEGQVLGQKGPHAIALTLMAGLVLGSVVTTFFVWLGDDHKEDALTPLRKSLLGDWRVDAGRAKAEWWPDNVRFSIEPAFRKLMLEMKTKGTSSHESNVVNVYDVALKAGQPLALSIYARFTLHELETTKAETVRLFMRLTQVHLDDESFLKGTWYDLSSMRSGTLELHAVKKT